MRPLQGFLWLAVVAVVLCGTQARFARGDDEKDGCPGAGHLDFRTVLTRMEALSPEYPILPEGPVTEELPGVVALFRGLAAELGITILENHA